MQVSLNELSQVKGIGKKIIQGDCLEKHEQIESGSVDLILTDPPYGNMKGAELDGWDNQKTGWDNILDPYDLFEVANRILRKNGKLILFSQEPYTSQLITNSINNLPFSYRMVWLKDHFANSLIAKKAPVSYFEDILVFKKNNPLTEKEFNHPLREYFAKVKDYIGKSKVEIMDTIGQRADHTFRITSTQFSLCTKETYQELIDKFNIDNMQVFKQYNELKEIDKQHKERFESVFNLPEGQKYKSNVLEYSKDYDGFHPTQKPVALLEDLIKRYTNEGDLVVDLTAGSGTTGVACQNTGRDYILIEQQEEYINVIKDRLAGDE